MISVITIIIITMIIIVNIYLLASIIYYSHMGNLYPQMRVPTKCNIKHTPYSLHFHTYIPNHLFHPYKPTQRAFLPYEIISTRWGGVQADGVRAEYLLAKIRSAAAPQPSQSAIQACPSRVGGAKLHTRKAWCSSIEGRHFWFRAIEWKVRVGVVSLLSIHTYGSEA